jgi:hypothetical protein
MEAEIETIKQLVEINTRRIDELEATAFQLDEEEDVILVTVPRRSAHNSR